MADTAAALAGLCHIQALDMMYETALVFPTHVYKMSATHLLADVDACAVEYLCNPDAREGDGIGVVQSGNFFDDPRALEFCHYVAYRCWRILEDQGYLMAGVNIHFSEMWAQEYGKYGYMEPHTHAMGSVLTGFYFLEVPENAPSLVLYDPRPGKVQANFGTRQSKAMLYAHDKAEMPVSTGDLVVTNSWLQHGFSPNKADKPFRLVHFNVVLQVAPPTPPVLGTDSVEVI